MFRIYLFVHVWDGDPTPYEGNSPPYICFVDWKCSNMKFRLVFPILISPSTLRRLLLPPKWGKNEKKGKMVYLMDPLMVVYWRHNNEHDSKVRACINTWSSSRQGVCRGKCRTIECQNTRTTTSFLFPSEKRNPGAPLLSLPSARNVSCFWWNARGFFSRPIVFRRPRNRQSNPSHAGVESFPAIARRIRRPTRFYSFSDMDVASVGRPCLGRSRKKNDRKKKESWESIGNDAGKRMQVSAVVVDIGRPEAARVVAFSGVKSSSVRSIRQSLMDTFPAENWVREVRNQLSKSTVKVIDGKLSGRQRCALYTPNIHSRFI